MWTKVTAADYETLLSSALLRWFRVQASWYYANLYRAFNSGNIWPGWKRFEEQVWGPYTAEEGYAVDICQLRWMDGFYIRFTRLVDWVYLIFWYSCWHQRPFRLVEQSSPAKLKKFIMHITYSFDTSGVQRAFLCEICDVCKYSKPPVKGIRILSHNS